MRVPHLIAALLAIASLGFTNPAEAKRAAPTAGFETASAPHKGDSAVPVTIWFPSMSVAKREALGPYSLDVALGGVPLKGRFPLVVLSHGTGGGAFDLANQAVALAQAGFVVAAVEHTGDNFHDRSRSFSRTNFLSRPRQISAALDFLLNDWHHKGLIDPARIGMLGHSAGGTTALIIGGGLLDWGQVIRYCADNTQDWGCQNSRAQNLADNPAAFDPTPVAAADRRVKVLAIAAPALTHGFAPTGLATVKLPVQLWVAETDVVVADSGTTAWLLPNKPEQHDVANAGHFAFFAPCPDLMRKSAVAAFICDDLPSFNRAAFQRQFTAKVVRFFKVRLRK